VKRHYPLAIVFTCIVAALVGCGGSASSQDEAHLAAVANVVCAKSETLGEHPGFLRADLARLRALIHSDRKLPRVSRFISDSAAQRRMQAAMRKLSKKAGNGAFFSKKEGNGSNPLSLWEESYRLDVKVQADLKALGVTSSCIGPRPRKPIGG
jgi:hypothetical protein